MPLINAFFQNSIFILLIICLLTLIFVFRYKKPESSNRRSETADAELHRLKEKLRHLQAENNELKKELQNLSDVIDTRDENSRKWAQRRAAEEEVRNNLSQYYYIRKSLMNKPESRMFFYINESIKKLSGNQAQDLFLFPQVNIYAFIDNISKNEEKLLLKVLGGKNVDFILCQRCYDEYYLYKPILMIEIDGAGHFYPIYNSYQKTRENDQLKNTLANELKLPLIRYRLRLPKGNIEKADKAGIHTALCKFFSDRDTKQTEYIYYYDQNGALSKNQYYNPPVDQT